ncbi:hypothetical protein ID035_31130 [Pseudomonas aeruginosa]|nr:hypothetical protein [Pseudomonas aeruginosa]MBO8364679.1 hypothetical protein [Pseudomonas aeruginosa]MBO8369064.1 hypothetical protein [Pseudomonas aeruginosa]
MNPPSTAGEQLAERVDLDHVQGMAIGAGGAEDLVPWIRPAWPASIWWSTSASITSRGWPPAPAAPRPGGVDPSGTAGEHLVEPVDLDHVQGMATGAGGAKDPVAWIRPARPASTWWSPSTSITSRGWPPAPWTWCIRRGGGYQNR